MCWLETRAKNEEANNNNIKNSDEDEDEIIEKELASLDLNEFRKEIRKHLFELSEEKQANRHNRHISKQFEKVLLQSRLFEATKGEIHYYLRFLKKKCIHHKQQNLIITAVY